MAKKVNSSSAAFMQVLSEIRAERIAPVYLLQGEEAYYIDKLSEAIMAKVVTDEEAREFDQSIFFGNETDIKQVADAARRYPIMSARQLVVLKEAQLLSNAKSALDSLAPYCEKPVAGTVLVIIYRNEPLKASSAIVKAIKKGKGIVFDSLPVKEYMIPDLIKDYCKDRSIKIDAKSVEMLKDAIGDDLSRLFGEIEKLTVASRGTVISPELIEQHVGISKDYNNYELLRAISMRDYTKAMQIVDNFARNPKEHPVIMTISVLFKYFSQLMLAHYAPDKSEAGLMAQLDLYASWQLREISAGLRRYTPGSVFAIIHRLRRLDCESKGIGSMQKDTALLRQFIYEAFTL